MKKMLFAVVLLFTSQAKAEILGEQILAALTTHGTVSAEYRHGSKTLTVSDSIVEIGKLKKDYVAALDLGINGATVPGEADSSIQGSVGFRVNAHTLVRNFVPIKQEWKFLSDNFEYYGRAYYNISTDAWYGSINVGYGFGPGTASK